MTQARLRVKGTSFGRGRGEWRMARDTRYLRVVRERIPEYIKSSHFNSATEPLMNCVTLEKSLYLSFLFCKMSLD